MREVNATLASVHNDALKTALQAALGSTKALGVTTYGGVRPISIWFALISSTSGD